MNLGNDANNVSFLVRTLLLRFGSWQVAARCSICGCGAEYAEPGKGVPNDGDKRFLCVFCGSDISYFRKWVGRKAWYGFSARYIWEWLPPERLPMDLQPEATRDVFWRTVAEAVEREMPARLDAEFHARVKAAVEVELLALGVKAP